jgi:hypothetical protein
VDWFDHIVVDTWSPLWLDQFVNDLGYLTTGLLKIYWLLPGKGLHDGLRLIVCDGDTSVMAAIVDKCKNFVLYFDHDDSFQGFEWDDIVSNPVTDLPKVISPKKVVNLPRKDGERLPEFYMNVETRQSSRGQSSTRGPVEQDNSSDSASSDSDYEDFYDSDYELEDDDDDLFVDSVIDEQVAKSKKAKGSRLKGPQVPAGNDDVSSDDDDAELELPEDDQNGVPLKFRTWREEDMNNPTFRVGLVFPSVVEFREAITEYGIRNRVQIHMPRNEKKRVRAHCAEGCPWNCFASWDSRAKAFVVKTYFPDHNCPREWAIRKCTAKWLDAKYLETFRANEKMSITSFGKTVQKDWNLTPSRSKLARARRLALKQIYGDEVQQYKLLWDYANEIRRSNPGSTFLLSLNEGLFKQCYVSFDACKRGFLSGCRPVICLDGCHIKTKFGGQLLTAVGIDPNDCIYPIAMAVVEVEDLVTWKWFLQTLVQDLGIDNTTPWTIMSDKQKVIIIPLVAH